MSVVRSLLNHKAAGRAFTRAFRSAENEFGGGGRSSVNGLKVAVFGATGFLGRYVCNELGQVGSTVYIANRGCEMETRHLKPMFDLGNAAFYMYHGQDEESIAKVMEGADVVVNMVGKRYETKHVLPFCKTTGKIDLFNGSRVNCSFEDVHVGVAERLASVAAKTKSVKQFVHLSALGASPDAASDWLRTKFEGEAAVKAAFPSATVVRPATMFGHEDVFLNWYAWCGTRGRMPLVEDGSALVQPVYVNDVAAAVMAAVEDREKYAGKTLELAGPAEYSRAEIVAFVNDITKMGQESLPVPKPVALLLSTFVEMLNAKHFTPSECELHDTDLVLDEAAAAAAGHLTFKDVGVEPTPVEKVAFRYLHRYRNGGHFVYAAGYH